MTDKSKSKNPKLVKKSRKFLVHPLLQYDPDAAKWIKVIRAEYFDDGREDRVELRERILGEDDESSNMTTGSKLQQVQSGNIAKLTTGKITETLLNTARGIRKDEEGSTSLSVTTIRTKLSLTTS